jgi:4-amino-4-deoxy-L-arabinose transferase-like glycosyltransferase
LSKSSRIWGTAVRVVFLVLIALIALTEPVLVLIFFIPIVGWLVWRDQDRIATLEKRLAALEKPEQKPAQG